MAKFTKTGNWYIDSMQGKSFANGGTGTKENPFKFLNDVNSATTAAGQKVIISGYFSDNLAVTKTGLDWEGEGVAIIDGYNVADGTTCLPMATRTIKNIKFMFFQGNSLAVNSASSTGGSWLWENNEFHYCQINHGTRLNLSRCVFNDVYFNTSGASPGNTIPLVEYCTFINCKGWLSTQSSFPITFVIRNNIFHLCSALAFKTGSGDSLPTSRPANSEFNYNVITDSVAGKTHAQWQAFGSMQYQGAGRADQTNVLFNDYDAGRDDLTFFMNDFSIKWDSPIIDASKDGIEIGARRRAFYMSASNLWNNFRDTAITNNLTYSASRGIIMLNTELGIGTFRSLPIPLPNDYTFDRLNFAVQFVYLLGAVKQYIDYEADAAPNSAVNIRTSFDIGLAYNTTGDFSNPVFKRVDINNPLLFDGNGNGNANDSFDAATAGKAFGGFIMIEFNLRAVA